MILYLIVMAFALAMLLSAVVLHMSLLNARRPSSKRSESEKAKRARLDDIIFN